MFLSGALKHLGLLGPQELVSLLDAGGGALGHLVSTVVLWIPSALHLTA